MSKNKMLGFKHKEDDNLYNRRKLMVFSAVYMVIWGLLVLACTIAFDFETGTVVAFLSYIATLSGTGIFGYIWAANKDDRRKIVEAIAGKISTPEEKADQEPPLE